MVGGFFKAQGGQRPAGVCQMVLARVMLHLVGTPYPSLQLKQVPHEEGRNAELALYRRRPDEAEAILIQVGCLDLEPLPPVDLFTFNRLPVTINRSPSTDTQLTP